MSTSVIFGGAAEFRTLINAHPTKYKPLSANKWMRAIQVKASGDKIQDWVSSPFLVATFGPRVALGALLTAPDRIVQLPDDLNSVSKLLSGSQPVDEKASILLEEVEIRVTECLERGASAESDIYQNLRSLLPENLQENFPEELPFVPKTSNNAGKILQADVAANDTSPVTYTAASVSEEKAASEATGLSDAIVAVKTAQSALRMNTSQAREKMLQMNLKEEKDVLHSRMLNLDNVLMVFVFLLAVLSEITTGGAQMTDMMNEARALLKETEDQI